MMSKIGLFLLMIKFTMILILCSSCATTTKIGKPINRDLNDGVYEGVFSGGPNKAFVKVMISNNKIVDIQIIEHRAWKGKKAESFILGRIIKNQRTNVDVVSGATNSSIVIMNAVQRAVEKAYKDK